VRGKRARVRGRTAVACNLLPASCVCSHHDLGCGADGGDGCAAAVMRRDIRPVTPEDTLGRAAERMATLHTRELPVVEDGGRVVGIVSQSDLLPHRGHYEWTQVRAVMSPDVATVDPDALVADVARLLLAHGINAVPVVQGDRLVGMISRVELLRPLADRVREDGS
jgi:CBS domain-containing protein